MNFSIGIYSCPMDTMDSIGRTFHALIQHEWNFSKSLTNRKWTFSLESIRFHWIRLSPSEGLYTPSSNMSLIYLSPSRIENELFHRNIFVSNLYDGLLRKDFPSPHLTWVKFLTNRKWTFPSESIRVQWIRWTPSERLSTPSSNMSGISLSLSQIENELFHRNLFVFNRSVGLHGNDFPLPHPTWLEFF